MKVIQLFGSMDIGGAEILTYDLCKHYSRNLGEQILVSYKGGKLIDKFEKEEIAFHEITKGAFGLSLIFNLRWIIKKHGIDIIHTHKTLDVFYAKLASIGTHAKVVQTIHSLGDSISYTRMRKLVQHIVDYTMFVSNDLLKKYRKKHPLPKNIKVLYNGVDQRKFSSVTSSITFPKIPKNAVIAGMIGNFNKVRDHLTVCKALKRVLRSNANFHFIFVGDDQGIYIKSECENFCREHGLLANVHFLGQRRDIPVILEYLDLFVYSSNRDTFGIAVVEAMMSGTPVIVNDLPVFKEITDEGKYAELYRTKNPGDLANKMEGFIRNPDSYQKKAEEAKAFARKRYSIESHIEKLTGIYREVLNN